MKTQVFSYATRKFPLFLLQLVFIFLLSITSMMASAMAANDENIIVVLQGEEFSMPHTGAIWIENSQVLKATDTGKIYLLKSLKPGSTEVRISNKSTQIHILSLAQMRTQKILNTVLNKTLGLHIEIQSGSIYIRGHLVRWKDLEIIAESCRNQNCQYIFQATIPKEIQAIVEFEINKMLLSHALDSQKINFANSPTIYFSEKSQSFKKYETLLAPYGISIERDPNALELAPLIRIQIVIVEIKKDFLLQHGIKWPSSYQAQILPSIGNSQEAAFVEAQFWEHSGGGKILASPNLLCRSGKEAEFLAGGEFPIKIISFKMQDLIWKKYGIILKVSPHADYSGRMSISLQTEVSSIDPSRTVDGIPGLFINRVQSHFDLHQAQTIALSGLIKSEESRNLEGFPVLGNIPILGSLFSSKEFRNNKTELVIFVRPEILKSIDEDAKEIPDDRS